MKICSRLLIIKYYETFLGLVIDICYIVNLIHYKMIRWPVKKSP